MTKSLTLGILFSTAVRAVVVVAKLVILGISFLTWLAKLVILGILFLTSFTLALGKVVVTKLVVSGILSSIFFFLALYTSFLTIFFTISSSLLKSTGTGFNLSASNPDNLSISNLWTSDFKSTKSFF